MISYVLESHLIGAVGNHFVRTSSYATFSGAKEELQRVIGEYEVESATISEYEGKKRLSVMESWRTDKAGNCHLVRQATLLPSLLSYEENTPPAGDNAGKTL
ncbi:MAG: hypothetical protein MJZ68_01580 [archaeon]|nr:hypothetical protein [archaeon]